MSLKSRLIIKKSFKIAIFSLLILIIINLWLNFGILKANTNEIPELNSAQNLYNFKNNDIKPIASVATAISTNLWIKLFKNQNNNISNIYNNIYSADEILKNSKNLKNDILWKNMLYIKDYYNFIKSDFNTTLKKSTNKKTTLESILNQLELRYKLANKNATFLINQRTIVNKAYNSSLTNIENIKNKIRYNYKNNKLEELYQNMDDYYAEKNKETIYKTYILYINDLLKKYLILNNYNEILINTLKLNKDIISKDSYIVIPDSWTEILKKYELILTESEYKNKKNEE